LEEAVTAPSGDYPVRLSIDYPDRKLSRLSTFFRLLIAVPVLILLGLLAGGETTLTLGPSSFGLNFGGGLRVDSGPDNLVVLSGGGILVLPVLLMLLIRRKYPKWWFDWNLELSRFTIRAAAYMALMNDRYPSTDEQQTVHLHIDYPDAGSELNRWLPLVKWLLALPHYVILFFLGLGAVFCVVVAWFAILFTGRYPRALFHYVEGVARWEARVGGYAFLLVTDRYPPFSLAPLGAAPGGTAAIGEPS
jgi:hypothetical protein